HRKPVSARSRAPRALLPVMFLCFSFLTSFLLLGLHLIEQGIQALEGSLPELAVQFQPLRGLGQWGGFQFAPPALSILSSRDQSGALQHFEVLGDRRLGHGKRLSQLIYRSLARCQPRQNRAPRRIGQRGEDRIQALSITAQFHNLWVIYFNTDTH